MNFFGFWNADWKHNENGFLGISSKVFLHTFKKTFSQILISVEMEGYASSGDGDFLMECRLLRHTF